VHLATIAFEKHVMHTVRRGNVEPHYEKVILDPRGASRLEPDAP
jgi:hypothetical protein